MKVYVGSDHRGFELKEKLVPWLREQNHEVVDCGNSRYDKDDDFPDFAFAVAKAVSDDPETFGVVICGSGGGVTVCANKVKGIRCSTAVSIHDVVHNRQHNDMNVLAVGADYTSEIDAKAYVSAFLETPFNPQERFVRRLKKIEEKEV